MALSSNDGATATLEFGNFSGRRGPASCGEKMNVVLKERPVLAANHFGFGAPVWIDAAKKAGFVIWGFLLGLLAAMSGNATSPLIQILWFFAVVLIIRAFLPSQGRCREKFACDHTGLFFPDISSLSMFFSNEHVSGEWLHVPWKNVRSIRCDTLPDEAGNRRGVVIALVASASERGRFFPRYSLYAGPGMEFEGVRQVMLVGYASPFHRPDDVAHTLNQFRIMSQHKKA